MKLNEQQKQYREAKPDWFEGYACCLHKEKREGTHYELLYMIRDNSEGDVTVSFAFYRMFQIGGSWELSCEHQMNIPEDNRRCALELVEKITAFTENVIRTL